jgi:hypothetical protein
LEGPVNAKNNHFPVLAQAQGASRLGKPRDAARLSK